MRAKFALAFVRVGRGRPLSVCAAAYDGPICYSQESKGKKLIYYGWGSPDTTVRARSLASDGRDAF